MANNENVIFDIDVKDKTDKKIAKPRRYKVVFLNDNYTTMQFVTDVLQRIFHRTQQDAESIMKSVHQTGKGIAGIYTFEVAETKATEVLSEAKVKGFPLAVKLEPVENS